MASTLTRLLPVLALVACKGGKDDTDSGADSAAACATDTLALTDANNYTFSGALNVPRIETAEKTDIQICWDDLTEDIQCHDMDPATDIDNVGLVRFSALTQADVEAGLSNNDLQQSEMSGYVAAANDGGTCTSLSAMSFFGTAIDVASEYTADGGTYLLLLTTGTTAGVGARMVSFLQPSADSTTTSVNVANGCGTLDFTVDLHSLQPASVCDTAPLSVDWSGLAHDGQGNEMDTSNVDLLTLGFYAGKSVTDLEENFLDLELIADTTYSLSMTGGTTADLATAMSGDTAFPGFEGDGLWVLALRCTRCSNPAPLFITVVEAGGGA